jgi:dTDP-4-dehydrorhamnose reductase
MKALVFGHSGMLGHEMVRVLRDAGIHVETAGRSGADIFVDAEALQVIESDFGEFDFFVNCIGLITHNIDELDPVSVASARSLNSEFPKALEALASKVNARVIQIATDCVFLGKKGSYAESDPHDAKDVYGVTKSEGEIKSSRVMHLRASIVGRELKGKKSLLEWVLGQPKNATIPGFTDRMWNGVTTTAFAKVVAGVIKGGTFQSGVWHLVPKSKVSKAELVQEIATVLGRTDITVVPRVSGVSKDLTLATNYPSFNQELWEGGGYKSIPSVSDLISELAK